ncbi:hypothetical protein P879_02765 [Paragonimus westermani]|uniref:Uncharacterized protein n=1 Tax=Paragonimus westermani TaxID=34504 RepID=A0A8T0DUR8_9TREM|nr:hypothetical protein P879_02765 [Paragonimus westermani]
MPETNLKEPDTQPQACERPVGKSQYSTVSHCQSHSGRHGTSAYRHEKRDVSRRNGNTFSFNPTRPQACLLSSESQTVQWTTLCDQINNSAENEDTQNAEPTARHNLELPTELTQIPFSEIRAAQPAKLSLLTARSFGNRKSLPGLTSDCSKPAEYTLPEPEHSKQISNDKCKVLSNLEEKDTSAIETANLLSNGQPKMEHNETDNAPNVSDKSACSGKISPTTVDYKERRRKTVETKAAEEWEMILAMTEEAALERRDHHNGL